jgi:hypothetical protein
MQVNGSRRQDMSYSTSGALADSTEVPSFLQ